MKLPVIEFKKRGCDDFGCGHFGAPRGNHTHKGLDLVTKPNEDIFSPINGKITKQGFTYAGDLSYRYVRIEDKEYKVELYYTKLFDFIVGDTVTIFDMIATAQDIAKKFNNKYKKEDGTFKVMKNHLHIQVYDKKLKKWINPLDILEI